MKLIQFLAWVFIAAFIGIAIYRRYKFWYDTHGLRLATEKVEALTEELRLTQEMIMEHNELVPTYLNLEHKKIAMRLVSGLIAHEKHVMRKLQVAKAWLDKYKK